MSDQGEGQSGEGKVVVDKGDQSSSAETYKVVVSGQEIEVPLTELVNGYQRQADYTKKTQELSGREKKLNESIEARAMELYLEALKKGEGKGDKADEGQGRGQEDEDSPRLKALEERIAKSDADRINAEAERELNVHIERIAKAYPKADVDKVLIDFYKKADDGTDVAKFFDETAAAQHKAAEAYDQKIIDDYVKRRTERAFGGVESGGSTVPTGKAPQPAKTFEEARERAEQRLEAARGGG